MRGKSVLTLLSVLASVVLSSCGASGGPSRSLRVTMTDFAFSPNSFTVPAGEKISVVIANNGAVTHSFIIMKAGQEVKAHFTDADKAGVYWEEAAIPPGESVQSNFTAPAEPGQYQIVCGVGGHFEAGMVAKLVVVAP